MRKLLLITLLISILLTGCAQIADNNSDSLLKAGSLKDIVLSHAEGSGSVRTLTIHYTHDGKEESATIHNLKRIDLSGYDDENGREQTFTASDYDGDGVFDIIVYREFWFPDIIMAHAGIPEWPTVYEFDTEKGFVVASAKHKDYFETYAKAAKEQLDAGKEHMNELEILALSRLVYAAETVAAGNFVPKSDYNGKYYEDIYELTKAIKE